MRTWCFEPLVSGNTIAGTPAAAFGRVALSLACAAARALFKPGVSLSESPAHTVQL